MLEATGYNLEAAVNLHFASGVRPKLVLQVGSVVLVLLLLQSGGNLEAAVNLHFASGGGCGCFSVSVLLPAASCLLCKGIGALLPAPCRQAAACVQPPRPS